MTEEQRPTKLSLIEDLEAIKKSLKKVADSSTVIPTLEEIVDDSPASAINPENPFLSGSSLSELIRIRNEAEARAARELAKLGRIKPIDEILATADGAHTEPAPQQAPDPDEIIERMEELFHTWIEISVKQYLNVFENELRNHLQQDFRQLVTQWYEEYQLPLPESFQQRQTEEDESGDAPDKPSQVPDED